MLDGVEPWKIPIQRQTCPPKNVFDCLKKEYGSLEARFHLLDSGIPHSKLSVVSLHHDDLEYENMSCWGSEELASAREGCGCSGRPSKHLQLPVTDGFLV